MRGYPVISKRRYPLISGPTGSIYRNDVKNENHPEKYSSQKSFAVTIRTFSNRFITRRSLSPLTIYKACESFAHSKNLSSSGARHILTCVTGSMISITLISGLKISLLICPCFLLIISCTISSYSLIISGVAQATIFCLTTALRIFLGNPPKKHARD